MKGGHTPGPWSYRSEPHDDWGIVRAGRWVICQARDPDVYTEEQLAAHRRAKTDPWEANARLIAAAPDLQEALQIVRRSLCWQVMSADLRALVEAALLKSQGDS